MPEGSIHLESAKGWAVDPTGQPGWTAVVFQMHKGDPIGVLLADSDMGRFASRIISEAGRIAATRTPPMVAPQTLAVDPVMVSRLGLGKGRSDSEAFLSMEVGNLHLTFAVDLTTLADMCKNLESMTVRTPPRKPS